MLDYQDSTVNNCLKIPHNFPTPTQQVRGSSLTSVNQCLKDTRIRESLLERFDNYAMLSLFDPQLVWTYNNILHHFALAC